MKIDINPKKMKWHSKLYFAARLRKRQSHHWDEARIIKDEGVPNICKYINNIASEMWHVFVGKVLPLGMAITFMGFMIVEPLWFGYTWYMTGTGEPITKDYMFIGVDALLIVLGIFAAICTGIYKLYRKIKNVIPEREGDSFWSILKAYVSGLRNKFCITMEYVDSSKESNDGK